MDDNERTERIPQAADSQETDLPDLYEAASAVARRVLESSQEIAGTTYCKGVQIAELTKWAKANGFWIASTDLLGEFSDRGSENEVYVSSSGTIMFKLNDFRYSDDNLSAFFDRLEAHNHYFPDCGYQLIGFAENHDGKTCAVLAQPFIVAEREATDGEIKEELQLLGFTSELNGEYFTNGVHDIFDALPNNVLMGIDGRLYFIDTIIYKSATDTLQTYKSLSPRYK